MSEKLYQDCVYISVEPYDDKEKRERIFMSPLLYKNVKKYFGSNSAENSRFFNSTGQFINFCINNGLILCDGVKYISKSGDNK